LVVTTPHGLLVLRQDSDAPGTFPATLQLAVDNSLEDDKALPIEQHGLAVADLDGDTVVDVATVRWDFDGVRIYRNDPAMPGTFETADKLGLSLDAPEAFTVGDLNRDDYEDLIATGEDDFEVVVHVSLRNPASPQTFQAHRGFKLDDKGGPIRVVIADVTADGLPDVLVAKRYVQDNGYVEILKQTGPSFNLVRLSIFPTLTLNGVDPYLRGFAVADLNDDGLIDFAIADGELSVQFNDPAAPGQFLSARPLLD